MTYPSSQPVPNRDLSLLDLPGDYEDLSLEMDHAGASPAAIAVNKILLKAIQQQVVEIHIEPQEQQLKVEFRKDGLLQPAYEKPLPAKVAPALTARLKVMADLDPTKRSTPQVGRFQRRVKDQKIHGLLRTFPSQSGERVVVKFLDYGAIRPLEHLIPYPETYQTLQEILQASQGLLLLVGAAYAGQSITLSAIGYEQSLAGRRVYTVERPIEYHLPGLQQTGVASDNDFAAVVRATVLEKPQVMVVSEIGDRATALAVLNAAKYSLVVAILPCEDVITALNYLRDLGLNPIALAQTLLGILNQRLLLSPAKDTPAEVSYKGQVGVYEILRMTPRLQALMEAGSPAPGIYQAAVLQEGMVSLYANSLTLLHQGAITPEELERVVETEDAIALHHQLAISMPGESALEVATAEAGLEPLELLEILDPLESLEAPAVLELVEVPDPGEAVEGSETQDPEDSPAPIALAAPLEAVETLDSGGSPAEALEVDPWALSPDQEAPPLEEEELTIGWKTLDDVPLEVLEPATPPTDLGSVAIDDASEAGAYKEKLWDEEELIEAVSQPVKAKLSDPDEPESPLESARPRELEALGAEPAFYPGVAAELETTRRQLRDLTQAHAQLQMLHDRQIQELENYQTHIEALLQKQQDMSVQMQRERTKAREDQQKLRTELTNQAERQKVETKRQAKKSVLLNLLDAMDSFGQANAQLAQSQSETSSVYKGYQAIYRLLMDSLKKAGLSAIEAVGKPFDPNFHEAVMMETSTEYDCDTVVAEFRRGYLLDEIILRPTQVKVAVHQEAPEEPEAEALGVEDDIVVGIVADPVLPDPVLPEPPAESLVVETLIPEAPAPSGELTKLEETAELDLELSEGEGAIVEPAANQAPEPLTLEEEEEDLDATFIQVISELDWMPEEPAEIAPDEIAPNKTAPDEITPDKAPKPDPEATAEAGLPESVLGLDLDQGIPFVQDVSVDETLFEELFGKPSP